MTRAGIIKAVLFAMSLLGVFGAFAMMALGELAMGACAIGAACYLMLLVVYLEVYMNG